MPYFRYIGEKEVMPNVYGYTFEGKKPVEVTEEKFINKLTNNSHFEKVPKPRKQKVTDNVEDAN